MLTSLCLLCIVSLSFDSVCHASDAKSVRCDTLVRPSTSLVWRYVYDALFYVFNA